MHLYVVDPREVPLCNLTSTPSSRCALAFVGIVCSERSNSSYKPLVSRPSLTVHVACQSLRTITIEICMEEWKWGVCILKLAIGTSPLFAPTGRPTVVRLPSG